ncbi:hypothetical protein [Anaerotalea alkaliphila]|uniref:Uncharacterized protein n=1 Tax=Anaerotalea alkaliphila TaxID=2662126 RepID=A0A7X5HVB1_9FIRM|nr:hypothetical protein [Anaerotalea alkaliphila]NDL67284.1 hypothetical protein [Anaerotalea alkaliphila]
MKNGIVETYQTYASKIGNRKALYGAVAKEFDIRTAIYPGSHIDIAPSMVIPKVTYIDNCKGAIDFFKRMDAIREFIGQNKEYPDACEIYFLGQDFTKPLEIEESDLLISQYAGFVGQAAKKLLKVGGILLSNDSHGDATLARFDEDYGFIGIVDRQNRIRCDGLDKYFALPKGKPVYLEAVRSFGRKRKGAWHQQD